MLVNKYQEALEVFADYTRMTQHNINELEWANEVLQELVDKETPMKPIYETFINSYGCKDYRYLCGKCKYILSYEKRNGVLIERCKDPECNQVVDWSDDNE